MMSKLFAVLAVGFALGQWAAARQQQASRSRLDNPRATPDALSNWEGEGGALPVTEAADAPDASLSPALQQP